MATTAIRANQEQEMNRQVAATNYGAPVEARLDSNGIPILNDAALEAHIRESLERDASYQRAQNSQQREEIENSYRARATRLDGIRQQTEDRAKLETAQQAQRDVTEGDQLAIQMQALTDSFPANWTPETLPLDKLHALSTLRQRVQMLAAATGSQGLADGVLESGGPLAPANVLQQTVQQTRPETFPDGQAVHVTQNQDGTLHVEYATGEKFDGDPLAVTQRIGQAHVNTKLWARQQRAQSAQPTVQPQQPQQQILPPEPTQQSTIADFWADQQAQALAKQFGFSDKNELLEWGKNVSQTVEQMNDQQVALEFMARCPEYPETEKANNALLSVLEVNGWPTTPDNLQAAHLVAVQRGMYQPLSQEMIRVANGAAPQNNRAAAPPMIHGGNPEESHRAPNPYEMNMADLRKAAIKEELERSGARY